MKFRSPTDDAIHVALTNGMTANITPEGVELDPMFHREAIARGALPAGIDAPPPGMTDPAFNRKEVIAKVLQTMLDGSDPDDFKKDGTPDLRRVSRLAGFAVQRDEAEAAWAEANPQPE